MCVGRLLALRPQRWRVATATDGPGGRGGDADVHVSPKRCDRWSRPTCPGEQTALRNFPFGVGASGHAAAQQARLMVPSSGRPSGTVQVATDPDASHNGCAGAAVQRCWGFQVGFRKDLWPARRMPIRPKHAARSDVARCSWFWLRTLHQPTDARDCRRRVPQDDSPWRQQPHPRRSLVRPTCSSVERPLLKQQPSRERQPNDWR